MVAALRARSTAAAAPLCRDEWAAALAGEEGEGLAERMLAANPHLGLWVAARSAWLDRAVARATEAQVVILGAGFDTRAARLARSGRRFFEVDAPASAAEKRRRLAALEGYPADAATQVECDFEQDDFVERLAAAGFDRGAPACVIWEGVSYYLPEAAVRATLRRVAEGLHPESRVHFDFVGTRFVRGQTEAAEDAAMRGLVADLGEPMVWGVNDPLPLLYDVGFRRVFVDGFDEIVLALTGTYERERAFRFQYVAEASVAAELR
ncbi:MAG: hypothetical protein CMN29_04545 [Sandaracinus sp.]|nr:hypothetical protein [Sandaracinus sp.]